jgi:hypothetical protein
VLTLDARDPTPVVNNGDGSRVFTIDGTVPSAAPLLVSISGLRLVGGDVGAGDRNGSGGAIWNNQNLTLSGVDVVGNFATQRGGGV